MYIDYNKPTRELLLDLINRDNPQLDYPVTLDNCKISSPTAVTPFTDEYGYRNTVVTIVYTGEAAAAYVGPVKLHYRRLVPGELFPGGRVIVDHYRASGNIPKLEYIQQINDRYGLSLDPSDISSGDMGNHVHVGNITLAATCPAFVGVIPYSRISPAVPISAKIPAVLANWEHSQTSGNMSYLPLLFANDFTPFDHLIKAVGNTFQNIAVSELLRKVMSDISGVDFSNASPRPFNTNTIRATIYSLPHASAPKANSEYRSVMVITPLNAASWLKDEIYLHYNEDV